jgi:azurin
MTGMIRKATILVALWLVAATAATAGTPNAANCTAPAFIKVVGSAGGVADARGLFTVTVRDDGNLPIEGVAVEVDFTNCTDMSLCNVAGVTCNFQVMAVTNVLGVASFKIVGGGKHIGGVFAGPGLGCVTIRAANVFIRNATAIVYDLNGAIAGKNGVNIGDLSRFLADLGAGIYRGRTDYNASGTISIADLSGWLQCNGAGTSIGGCATTYCW